MCPTHTQEPHGQNASGTCARLSFAPFRPAAPADTRALRAAPPQGLGKLKKPERPKQKRAPRGDQQKLSKGNFDLKPKIGKAAHTHAANVALTKKITARIEQTMAARAATDGGGLSVLKSDGPEKMLKPNASVLSKTGVKPSKR